MNRFFIATILICMLPFGIFGAELERELQWLKPVQSELEAGKLYKFHADGEIFAHCHSFPHDLRIIDASGRQLPFFLSLPSGSRETSTVEFESLNRSRAAEAPFYWRQDLRVASKEDGTRPRHNRLKIETSGSKFMRRVEVFGSDDGESWQRTGAGFLIRMHRPTHVSNNTIEYPLSSFRYLQIRVYADSSAGLESFDIRSIELQHDDWIPGSYEEVALSEESAEKEQVDDAQVFVFDSGYAQRPVERLEFSVSDPHYARPVRVYGRAEVDGQWRAVASGEIHDLEGSSNTRIDLRNCDCRHLKIEVYHYDDVPLEISAIQASAHPRRIVFETIDAGEARVYFGAEFIDKPRYDLQRRVPTGRIAELPAVSLGAAIENTGFKAPGFGAYGPWIAAVAIGLVSVAVIKVIVDMLKRV